MPLSPPLCLYVSIVNNGGASGNDYPVIMGVITEQNYMANGTTPSAYNGTHVEVGMYTTSSLFGYIFRIKSISLKTATTIEAVLEDINGLNKSIDPSQGVSGGGPDNDNGYIFELNSDGFPALTAIQMSRTLTFSDSILGRFIYDRSNATYRAARLYVRGTGINNTPARPRLVVLDGTELVNTSTRGLTLTIINGVTLAHVSSTNYDTHGSGTDSDNLATALNGVTRQQIGVLSSYDAWEAGITANLRTAAIRVGLSKLGGFQTIPSVRRRPYAAVFYGGGSDTAVPTREVVERVESNDADAPVASIFVELTTDGTYGTINGVNSTNALYNPNADTQTPVVLVNSDGNVGIGINNPRSLLQIVKTPVTDTVNNPLGVPDSNTHLAIYNNVAYQSVTPVYMEIGSHARTSGNFGSIYKYRLGYLNTTNAGNGGNFVIDSVPVNSSSYNSDGTIVNRLTIEGSSGNFGIGTSSPQTRLHVARSSNDSTFGVACIENTGTFGFGNGLNFGTSLTFRSQWQGDGLSAPVVMGKIDAYKEQAANYGDSFLAFSTRYESNRVSGGAGVLAERMRLSAVGNLGIGTTNPTNFLHIQKGNYSTPANNTDGSSFGIHFGSSNYINQSRILTVDRTTSGGAWSGELAFHTALDTTVSEKVRISGGGNVGIGTTNPQAALHVNRAAGNNYLRISGDTTQQQGLEFFDSAQRWVIYKSGNTTDLRFYGGSADRMKIDSSGNVGIGVNAAGTLDNTFQVDRNVRSGTHGSTLAGYFTKETTSNTQSIVEVRHANGTAGIGVGWDGITAVGSSASQNIQYTTKGSANHIFTDFTSGEVMRIVGATSRVGIGTGDPQARLHVNGDVIIGGSSSSNLLRFRGTTGDENINHTVIAERIYGGSEVSELVLFKGNDPAPSPGPDRIRHRAAQHVFQTYTSFEDWSGLADNNTRMIILNNGNVGIGTLDPPNILSVSNEQPFSNRAATDIPSQLILQSSSARLKLGTFYTGGAGTASTIQSADFFNGADNGTALLINPRGGQVAIATSNVPPAGIALDVNGTIRGSGSIVRVETTELNQNTSTWTFAAKNTTVDILSYTFTPKQSGNVKVIVEVSLEWWIGEGTGGDVTRVLLTDGSNNELREQKARYSTYIPEWRDFNWHGSLRYVDTITTGSKTYKIRIQSGDDGTWWRRANLVAMEVSSLV